MATKVFHFRDVALVDGNPAQHLDIVGHHVPTYLLATRFPLAPHHATAGVLGHGKSFRKQVIQGGFERVVPFLVEIVQLIVEILPIRGRHGVFAPILLGHHPIPQLSADLVPIFFDTLQGLVDAGPEFVRLGLQLLVGERCESGVFLVDPIDDGPELLKVAILAVTENLLQYVEHGVANWPGHMMDPHQRDGCSPSA